MKRYYVGLGNTCHDPAVAIVSPDGEVLHAEGLERPLQVKRAWGLAPDDLHFVPALVERSCRPRDELVVASSWSRQVLGLTWLYALAGKLRAAAYRRPAAGRMAPFFTEQYKLHWMLGEQFASIGRTGSNLVMRLRERFNDTRVDLRRCPHHLVHATYAAWTSPFDEAAVFIVDGFGEFGAFSSFHWRDGQLKPVVRGMGPGSLGYFYVRLTELCGFDPHKGEEWKVMGLAPYGEVDPELHALLRSTLIVDGGRVKFASAKKLARVDQALRPYARKPDTSPITVATLARTGQQVFEEVMTELLVDLHRRVPSANLIVSGGCALNSAYNGKIIGQTPFERLYVPSAPGDDGNAVGAALYAWRQDHPEAKPPGGQFSPYLGSTISDAAIAQMVRFSGLAVRHLPGTVHEEAARLLCEGKLLGWAQGRAEFGPRALGNRSILADPRSADMQEIINARVKFRESFRPFAPSILLEHGPDWFEDFQPSPYMERTLRWRAEMRDKVPAVVHVDGTGRLQTVTADANPRYHALLSAFHGRTGVPVLLNTSFNVMGKPIMHGVEDAIAVFCTSGLDALVLGDTLIEKPDGWLRE
ncbi:MAG: hypothetical protein KC620_02540 [Myxococcales bacterium]|nr:hypothetical protein [Myxococcales bacterium]